MAGGTHLELEERERLAALEAEGLSLRAIARALGRAASTVSRELRCADSLSLREFLRLGTTEPVPDHSWLSKTRSRLPLEVHEAVFAWVLERLAEHGLVKGDRIGVDASTMEANAALL